MENNYDKVDFESSKKFKSNQENRVINHGHVNKIKKQMENSLDVFPPITINRTTSNVIDGQHRLRAFQSLINDGGLPEDAKLRVMYVDVDVDFERECIINANTTSKNWSLDDYVASYARFNDQYQKLHNFCANHTLTKDDSGKKMKYRYGAAILKGASCQQSLKDGSFTVSDGELKKGDFAHGEMLELLGLLRKPTKGSFCEAMALSWLERREMHHFDTWLKELKKKKARLSKLPYGTKKDWNVIFNEVSTAIQLKEVM